MRRPTPEGIPETPAGTRWEPDRRSATGRRARARTRRSALRAPLGALAALLLLLGLPGTAVAAPDAPELPFTERYRVVQHGGIARAANSVITCVAPALPDAVPCPEARAGAAGTNGDYEMFYIDVDDDPNTYNSSRADLRLPPGARVTTARLYWGGNLLAGERKPAADNARVLFAEPGGNYKEILADTVIGHRPTAVDDGFTASADVTDLVRYASPGAYTVAQLNVAMGHSPVGTWGGWTLVVLYEHPDEPLRVLSLWDGWGTVGGNGGDLVADLPSAPPGLAGVPGLTARRGEGDLTFTVDSLRAPAGATGTLGVIGYDGDPGAGDILTVTPDLRPAVALGDATSPADDVMNSTIADLGRHVTAREPAHRNTLGYDSNLLDLGPALGDGANRLSPRFAGRGDRYHLGAVFLQVETENRR
ncbi:DUF3344 domain-containing protein [Streptomyces sp. ST2-7A]|uniref:DUF3344 domain-containing protein n=1 Tax=Streptomyces sp. ST2-7A TaxID=2907214 RepID=UPI001F28E5E4|nr:DUF3344 domain-containing protein [Streptomyces sp. ST2-7A]MCE7080674.1 DUF3344 domain-containing protein [Streptomyces sp. ST2-7A]